MDKNNLEQKLSETVKNLPIDELLTQRDRMQSFYDLLQTRKDSKKEDIQFYQENIFLYNNLIYIKRYGKSMVQT